MPENELRIKKPKPPYRTQIDYSMLLSIEETPPDIKEIFEGPKAHLYLPREFLIAADYSYGPTYPGKEYPKSTSGRHHLRGIKRKGIFEKLIFPEIDMISGIVFGQEKISSNESSSDYCDHAFDIYVHPRNLHGSKRYEDTSLYFNTTIVHYDHLGDAIYGCGGVLIGELFYGKKEHSHHEHGRGQVPYESLSIIRNPRKGTKLRLDYEAKTIELNNCESKTTRFTLMNQDNEEVGWAFLPEGEKYHRLLTLKMKKPKFSYDDWASLYVAALTNHQHRSAHGGADAVFCVNGVTPEPRCCVRMETGYRASGT